MSVFKLKKSWNSVMLQLSADVVKIELSSKVRIILLAYSVF